MAGNQFGFNFKSFNDIDDLLSIIKARLEEKFEHYNLTDGSIVYVQLTFRKLDLKLLSEFKLGNLNNIPLSEHSSIKRKLNIPVSVNQDSLGRPLDMVIVNNKIVNISLTIDNKKVNFLDIINEKASMLKRVNHVDNIRSFDSSFKFYLIRDKSNYVLAVNNINDKFIEKIRYSLNGVVINHVIDRLFNDQIIRKSGEKEIYLDYNNKILSTKLNIKLKPITKAKTKSSFIENPNIGVIDCETFLAKDGIQKIYALGFKTNLNPNPVIYYISKDNMDSHKIVLSMVDELLRTKYNKITFYCHNMGGYDIIFILKVLHTYNDNNEDKYNVISYLRDRNIITVKISKGNKTLIIKDSYCILNDSLKNLGKSFDVSILKSKFPYKFALENNLFYKGYTPKFEYYEDITLKEYNEIWSDNWSFYDETVQYLNNDINSLYEVIIKANKQIFLDYDVNMSDSNTISGLALRIFLKKYYNNNIPLINKSSIYKDIKKIPTLAPKILPL